MLRISMHDYRRYREALEKRLNDGDQKIAEAAAKLLADDGQFKAFVKKQMERKKSLTNETATV